jgi:serine protease Do
MRHRLSFASLCGFAIGAGVLLAPGVAHAQQMMVMSTSQVELIRGLLPAVVNITAFVSDTSAQATAVAASSTQISFSPKTIRGSGFIIDPSGVILTNDHVIAGAYDIHVMLSDGVGVPGRILAVAPNSDLALVKIEPQRPLTAVRWADSDKVQIGDTVLAIGNPLGIGLSVSGGIVSAVNRDLMVTPYDDFIQTDAAINHGNSGGPLFNSSGEVIGIDSAIISPTSGSVGLGFAIPSNDARFIATQLQRNGSVQLAYAGINVEQITQEMADALGMPQPVGSIVAAVLPGGPAAAAGLQIGDVILRYGDQVASDTRAMLRDVAKSAIGQPVMVTLLRAGGTHNVRLTPVAWPNSAIASAIGSGETHKTAALVPANLGLKLNVLTADLCARYGLPTQRITGVLVDGVTGGTDAFERGLVPGDVILRVQDTDVDSPQAVQAAVDSARAQHRAFILLLVMSKAQRSPTPHWMALRVMERHQSDEAMTAGTKQ